MQNVANDVLSDQENLLIDQTIARHEGHPGALLGILEAVQAANAHKYPLHGSPALYRGGDRHSAGPRLQRGHVLCAVQP